MTRFHYKLCNPLTDKEMMIAYLYSQKDELHLPDRQSVQNVVELCLAHGGIVACHADGVLGGMGGFFLGEPSQNFVNKETAFIYVATISEPFRLTRMFRQGLVFMLNHFQESGIAAIRMQAEDTNLYTQKLYGRFAKPIAKGKSLRGRDVITFGSTVEEALAYLQRGRRAQRNVQLAVASLLAQAEGSHRHA